MQKLFFLSLLTFCAYAGFSQQHFLDHGTIAPCNYTGNPKIRMEHNNVTVLLNKEIPVTAHVEGRVVSVFKTGHQRHVVVKTTEELYVTFQNLAQVHVKNGDEIQKSALIGMPLPGVTSGTWQTMISYDRPEGSLPCEQAIEMIRLSKPNEIVMGKVSK